MTIRYQQEIAYVRAYLTDEEIQRRISELSRASHRKSMVRWEDDTMTVKQMKSWAFFAEGLGAVAVDSYSIYREQTPDELREQVINAEHNKRRYVENDLPEDLTDPEAAAAEYAKTLYS